MEFDPSANGGNGRLLVSGRVEADEGLIGDWAITPSGLSKDYATGGLKIDGVNKSIDASDTSGNTIFRIKPDGTLPGTVPTINSTTIS